MRNFAAVVLLMTLITAQYAKQVSYLECRLSGALRAKNERCDCEKILDAKTQLHDPLPLPTRYNHVFPNDLYEMASFISTDGQAAFHSLYILADSPLVKDKWPNEIERPPQHAWLPRNG